jgi:hypothetical protein
MRLTLFHSWDIAKAAEVLIEASNFSSCRMGQEDFLLRGAILGIGTRTRAIRPLEL